jgi:hypothetical protein
MGREVEGTCLAMEWATPLASFLTQLKLQDKNKLLKTKMLRIVAAIVQFTLHGSPFKASKQLLHHPLQQFFQNSC